MALSNSPLKRTKTKARAFPLSGILFFFFVCGFALSGCQKTLPPDNGVHTVYYWKGGPIRHIKTYKDKQLNGPVKIYYKNGVLKVKTQYVNGKPDGEYRKFAQDGTLIIKATFKNGEVVEKENIYLKKQLENDMKD